MKHSIKVSNYDANSNSRNNGKTIPLPDGKTVFDLTVDEAQEVFDTANQVQVYYDGSDNQVSVESKLEAFRQAIGWKGSVKTTPCSEDAVSEYCSTIRMEIRQSIDFNGLDHLTNMLGGISR